MKKEGLHQLSPGKARQDLLRKVTPLCAKKNIPIVKMSNYFKMLPKKFFFYHSQYYYFYYSIKVKISYCLKELGDRVKTYIILSHEF